MKKMRRLIPAFAMLLVAATMLSTASFAWFTMSNTASASGMQVTATAGSSLLIVNAKKVTTDAQNNTTTTIGATVTDFLSANGILTLGAAPESLIPATSDNGVMKAPVGEDAIAGINPATGLAFEGDVQLTSTDITEENNYYYDYVVALASAGDDVTGKLTVALTPTYTEYLHNAVAVDFWYQEWDATAGAISSTKTFVDTIHFVDGGNGVATSLDLADSINIPLTNEDATAYILVTMRVYFDGALVNEKTDANPTGDDKAYVRNAYATTEGAAFAVAFTITPPTQGS